MASDLSGCFAFVIYYGLFGRAIDSYFCFVRVCRVESNQLFFMLAYQFYLPVTYGQCMDNVPHIKINLLLRCLCALFFICNS